jgi:hypothetical protein
MLEDFSFASFQTWAAGKLLKHSLNSGNLLFTLKWIKAVLKKAIATQFHPYFPHAGVIHPFPVNPQLFPPGSGGTSSHERNGCAGEFEFDGQWFMPCGHRGAFFGPHVAPDCFPRFD